MAFPVPGATTAELVRAFVEVTHEALKRAETAETELAEERKLAANLGLDNRALKDRLRERDETIAQRDETIAQQGRTQADSDTLVRRLRDTDATPLRQGSRDHLGPVVLCWCGMAHGAAQVTALNGKVIVADSAETPYLEARDIPAAGRDRIEKNT